MCAFDPLRTFATTGIHSNLMMTAALAKTLVMLAECAKQAEDEWWIVGSAAVILHGGHIPQIKDVDLLMSERDADAFLRRVGGEQGEVEPSERFRSAVFGIWDKPPIPVEAFGGFRLFENGDWRDVSLSTREHVTVGSAVVYVPTAQELAGLLRSFGRKKDLERAKLLPV